MKATWCESDERAYRSALLENGLALSEVAARTGIHPTTLFRWRKTGKLGPGVRPG